ncbi:MAG: hypothetical protein Q9P44_05965 [Anaerolineae bacterium]|nr:hypothetical protein [Anaerolineae bacterium]
MSSDYRRKYEAKRKDPLKPYYPIIGLILIGIAGAVGYFGRASVYAFVKSNLLTNTTGLPEDSVMEYVVAFGIGLVLIGVFSMVFAVFAPKPKNRKETSESTLKREKEEMDAERLRAKRRKAQMHAKMKKANRQKNQ